MVDVDQIAVKIYMLVGINLDGSIGWLIYMSTGREGELGEESIRWQINEGNRLGGELLFLVDKDILDGGMRGLDPVGDEWRHNIGCFDVDGMGLRS